MILVPEGITVGLLITAIKHCSLEAELLEESFYSFPLLNFSLYVQCL